MTLDLLKTFIGEIARPFAIISTSLAASISSVIIALKVKDGNDGYLFIGAVFLGVSSLYIGKALEVMKNGKHAAQVEIAKATETKA